LKNGINLSRSFFKHANGDGSFWQDSDNAGKAYAIKTLERFQLEKEKKTHKCNMNVNIKINKTPNN